MGGVPSVLLLLWCRGKCSTARVAAALTFFPPNPPCYTLRKKDDSGELELVLDEMLESTVPTDGVQIATIRSGASGGGGSGGSKGCGYSCSGDRNNGSDGRDQRHSGGCAGDGGSGAAAVSLSAPAAAAAATVSMPATSASADHPAKRKRKGWSRKGGAREKEGGKGPVIPVALYRAPGNSARYTLVYSHGNATDIGAMHDRCAGIAEACGVNVLAYDYSGYGAATGLPTEVETYRNIEAVCRWAREHVLREGEDGSGKNKSHGIILYGQSVGSGPTCYLAAVKAFRESFAGVILHSPILSGMRVLTESRALSCLDIYPNIDRISRVRCPVMVMHGMRDEEVPWEHGKGIHEAVPANLRRRPWWVPDRGHNDVCEGRRHLREYYARLTAFFHSLDEQQ